MVTRVEVENIILKIEKENRKLAEIATVNFGINLETEKFLLILTELVLHTISFLVITKIRESLCPQQVPIISLDVRCRNNMG